MSLGAMLSPPPLGKTLPCLSQHLVTPGVLDLWWQNSSLSLAIFPPCLCLHRCPPCVLGAVRKFASSNKDSIIKANSDDLILPHVSLQRL